MEDWRLREEKNKKDKRRYVRYAVEREGKALAVGWKKCTLIDVSSKGMGIRFHNCEIIDIGSTIYLEINVPKEIEPMCVKGILKWIKKEGENCIGGIELFKELDGYKCFTLRNSFTLDLQETVHKIY